MDHLPDIQQRTFDAVKIPCLCNTTDYDGLGVKGFPERKNWIVDSIRGPIHLAERESSPSSPAAFLQSWLFFGMLHDVFRAVEIDLNARDFVLEQDGEPIITTKPLKNYIDQWAKVDEERSPEVRRIHQGQLHQCLLIITNFFSSYLDSPKPGAWSVLSTLNLDFVLSILILGESLQNAANRIWYKYGQQSTARPVSFVRSVNLLKDRLIETGWCRSEVTMLRNKLDNTGLYVASVIQRPSNDPSHHASCTDESCVAYQVDEKSYETRHANDCVNNSNCAHIPADEEKVCRILKSGGIPMIFISPAGEDENSFKLRVLDYNDNNIDYIAFSHVWAHGLGNTKVNSLPRCQIIRLRRLSVELSWSIHRRVQKTAFWIDSLCIPVSPTNKGFRRLAIERLASTFRQSRHVLVLDGELQQTSRNCSRTELATRILCSGWMRRLWTLQEAVLTDTRPNCSKLDIQFLEGPLEFNALMQTNLLSFYNSESAVIALYSSLPQFQNPVHAFSTLTRALEYRSTSKLEDEAICLASILDIKFDEIAKLDTREARMRMFYSLVKELPSSILFHRGNRLSLDGVRWAPASLLSNHKFYTFSNNSTPASCDANGLHVQFFGYTVLHVPPAGGYHAFYVKEPEESFPSLWITSLPGTRLYFSESSIAEDPHLFAEGAKFDTLMRETKMPGIIINPEDSGESALVSIEREENNILYAKFLTKVFAKKPRIESSSHRNWEPRLLRTRKLSPDQRWCVG